MNRHFATALLLIALSFSVTLGLATGQSATAPDPASHSSALPPGTALVAELAKGIDAKKTRIGDPVKAKIVQDVIANGQIVIHRGAMLQGHITEAETSDHNEPQSVLGVVFDEIALKHGEKLRVKAALQALAPPVEQPDVLSGSSSYGGGSAGGSQPVSRGASKVVVVDPQDRVDHTRSEALRKAADPNSYGHDPNSLHNGFLGSGNRGVFGMPGVSLKSGSGAPGPKLVSTKADIKLESGTQLVLGIQP